MQQQFDKYLIGYIEDRKWHDWAFDINAVNEIITAVNSPQNKYIINTLPTERSSDLKMSYVVPEPYTWFMRASQEWVAIPKYTKTGWKTIEKQLYSFSWWVSFSWEELIRINNAWRYANINIEWWENMILSDYAKSFVWAIDRLDFHKKLSLEYAFWSWMRWRMELFMVEDSNLTIDVKSWKPATWQLTTQDIPVVDLWTLVLTDRWGWDIVWSTADPSRKLREWIYEIENFTWLEVDKIYMNRKTANALCDTPIYKNAWVYTNFWVITWVMQDPNDFLTKIWQGDWINWKIVVYDWWFIDHSVVPVIKEKFIRDWEIFIVSKGSWLNPYPVSLVYWPNTHPYFFWEMPTSPQAMNFVIWDYVFQERNKYSKTLDINMTTTCVPVFRNPSAIAKVKVF